MFQKIRKENNSLLINIYITIMGISFIAFLIAEIIPVSGVHKWLKSSIICLMILIIGSIPSLLRMLKVPERILTVIIINFFILFTIIVLFVYPYNLSLWALSFFVIGFSILFLDQMLLIYTETIYLIVNIINVFMNNQYMRENISQALVQRVPIIICFSIIAFIISSKYKAVLKDNFIQMNKIQNEIAEKNRAEDELHKSQNYLANVFNSLPSVLISVNTEGEITQWNTAAEKETGIKAEEAVSKKAWDVIPFLKKYERALEDVVREKKPSAFYRELVQDGKKRYFDVFFFLLVYDVINGVVIRLDDTTELEKKDEQLRQIQRMDTVRILSGGLAHDFNNILAAIIGTVSLMNYEIKNEGINMKGTLESISIIENSANRAADMVRNLLTLSSKNDIVFEITDLNHIVENVIKICKSTIDKSVDIKIHYYPGRAMLKADFTQIEEVILNLCINAWHAMTIMRQETEKQGGTLTISLTKQFAEEMFRKVHPNAHKGHYWKLSVKDTGVGMDAATIPRIFDPFFSTKTKTNGTGFGLAISFNIIQLHHGFIDVYSEKGRGSEFIVYIPSIDEKSKVERRPEEKIFKGAGLILLVDDEEPVLKITSNILEELGYRVITASNGEKALGIFRERYKDIDLVILDMAMPKMSGEQVFLEMKNVMPDVSVLLASGYKQDDRINESLRAGVQNFIQKPYTMSVLSKKIKDIIKK